MFRHQLRLWIAFAGMILTTASAIAGQPVSRPSDGAPGEGAEPGVIGPPVRGPVFAQVPQRQAAPGLLQADKTEDADEAEQSRLDEIERRAPVEKAKQSAWKRASDAARSNDWPRMLDQLERITGKPDAPSQDDSFIRRPDGTLTSSRFEVIRLLYRLPIEMREARARQFDGLARKMLAEAIESGDPVRLQQCAVLFAGTPIGEQAADRLINMLMDRGEFAFASLWIALLEEQKAALTQTPLWTRRAELVRETISSNDNIPAERRAIREQLFPSAPQAVQEWTLPGGNARRHAFLKGDTPILIQRWQAATTSSQAIVDRVRNLQEGLTGADRGAIPTAEPLAIGDRLILRTTRGIEVLNADDGQPVWTMGFPHSIERLLQERENASEASSDPFARPSFSPFESDDSGNINGSDPLSQYLFHNSAQNALSSDGRQLFIVDDDPVFAMGQTDVTTFSGMSVDAHPGTATANRLKALDLANGRLRWQLGGPQASGVFELPLSGWFFLGAPLPDGDELFVLAQRETTIRLFCLAAQDGSVRWSQPIAFLDEAINRNLIRRIHSVQISLAGGVLLCPTHAGWVVAVERTTGTLMWGRRLFASTPQSRSGNRRAPFFIMQENPGTLEVAAEPVGTRWCLSPPVVAGNRVILAPFESVNRDAPRKGSFFCLDLFTGERIWQLGREDGLYVAGIDGERIIVVGQRQVFSVFLSGKRSWRLPLPATDGSPSGRSLLVDGTLWLPMQHHCLLAIDVATGRIRERHELPDDVPLLGNLMAYRGLLISTLPTSVSAFEMSGTLERRLADLRKNAPNTVATALIEARLAMLKKEPRQAIQTLGVWLGRQLPASEREPVQALLLDAIVAAGDARSDEDLKRLMQLEESGLPAALELRRRQMLVLTLLHREKLSEALDLLDATAFDPRFDALTIRRTDDARIEMSATAWVTGEAERLWRRLSEQSQRDFEQAAASRLTALLQKARATDSEAETAFDSAGRVVSLLRFLTASSSGRRELASLSEQRGRPGEASFWRWLMSRTDQPSLAAEAMLLRLKTDLPGLRVNDLQLGLNALRDRYAKVTLSDGRTIESLLPDLQSKIDGMKAPHRPEWASVTVRLERSAPALSSEFTRVIDTAEDDPPAGQRLSAEVVLENEVPARMNFFSEADGSLHWSAPLRSGSRPEGALELRHLGDLVFVLNHGMLNCLSLADRRVLWTRSIDLPQGYEPDSAHGGVRLAAGPQWLEQLGGDPRTPLPVIRPELSCLRDASSLMVVETRTGRLRWRMTLRDKQVRVVAIADTLLLVQPNGEFLMTLSLLDGALAELSFEGAHEALRRAVLITESHLVSARCEKVPLKDRRSAEVENNETEVVEGPLFVEARSIADISGNRIVWSHEFAADSTFARIGQRWLLVKAHKKGFLNVLDLLTGQIQEFDKIPAQLRLGTKSDDYIALCDDNRFYLAQQTEESDEMIGSQATSIPVNGYVLAYDRKTGSLLWKSQKPIEHGGLITDQFRRNPALLITTGSGETIFGDGESFLTVIDKSTGTDLLATRRSDGSSFHSLKIDSNGQSIELQSGSERIRLTAEPITAKPAAE